jgi:Tfp pilus assembly protein PilX
MKNVWINHGPGSRYQAGVMTTFTGVLILVLLTLMMFFAIRVGVFEQRVSSNEMRQKLAFHAAESGIHHAKEFFRATPAGGRGCGGLPARWYGRLARGFRRQALEKLRSG